MASIYRSSSVIVNQGFGVREVGVTEYHGGYLQFGESALTVADLGSLTRLQDKIRSLQDDLQAERELRNRIERERGDLTVQLVSLTDRLEEAEGGSAAQIEGNRKREFELQNLRKLLTESQIEGEDNLNALKKKHQDSILDYQDQIEGLNKKNAKIDRERERLQHEVIELTATIDQVQKDKLVAEKAAEKFENEARELADKAEDLIMHVRDLTQQRARLQLQNNDLLKELHDVKIQVDNLHHVRMQLAQHLEETSRRLEEAESDRGQMQAQLHQVQIELDAVKSALDEESSARNEFDHKVSLAKTEVLQWKSKYEGEVLSHHEEVEDLRKKLIQKQVEYEERIEVILVKISGLEKAKSRLQSEVEVLIVDLEKAQNHIAILERAKEDLEKLSDELKTRVSELNVELEATTRELKATQTDLAKTHQLLNKAIEQKELLAKQNEQLQTELAETNGALAEATHRLHDLDVENARLAGEVRELQTGVREEETARREAENRAQKALSELQAMRVEMERRIHEKEEETEALRQNLQFEVDRLTTALANAETRMKVEITRLKKKYQAEIAELEVTVDNLNRSNIEAQKTIKKQAEQLKVLQASYDDVQNQLQQTLDQLALAQRRLAALGTELEECRAYLDNCIRARKQAEADLDEAHARITDLMAINTNLTSIKAKLETELQTVQVDLNEATKALRDANETEQKAIQDAQRAFEQLQEEQEHAAKIDAIRRGLEEQVRQLQVQIQEAEASALLGAKRAMSKLETRIRDLETALDEEARRHKETQIAVVKKERRVKEGLMQVEEERTATAMAQDTVDKLSDKMNIFKKQLADAENLTMQQMQRVRRYQHEVEEAEARADQAESSLSIIRVKHQTSVIAGQSESQSVYLMEEPHED